MAESVVSFLLEKLVVLAEKEVELLKDVQNEIEEMKREFQSIKAFLRDADAKVDIDQGVKEWVEQVRDVAYEIENVLDDYLFSHHTKEVDNHVGVMHGRCIGSIAGIFQRVIDFFRCLKSQHEIGTQIQDIRVRIQEISNRRQRYNINNSVEQGSTSFTVTSTTKRDPREDALFLEEFQLVGIEKSKEKLFRYLLETETRLGVVAVYGQGGLGKTTLVKKVYDNSRVKGQFPYRAWITISQTYDAKSLLKSLMKQLFPTLGGAETMEAIELKQMLNYNLRQKRYVVVLDDIWKLDAWKDLKNAFPNDNESGSRLMVTTRFENIARSCLEEYGHMYLLQPLDSEDSWKLFYIKAFKSNLLNMNFSPEHVLRDRSAKFLIKCNGLPLAIVAIGGLLSMKQPSK
ncbi:Disease resistance protein [Thalictrum thalictroides]|uniref:Disease resistance protein n=1 Tax=Thalictrum thalictroides TaxID=46969 RepID=A0A7J6WHF6_THATH|nr:Disease resistance protein [Thalictrum thalictroides]